MQSTRRIKGLKERLHHYSGATIFRLALLELPAILCVLCFYMTGQWVFIYMALFSVLLLLAHIPTRHRLITELDLNHIEKRIFENSRSKIN